MSGKSAAPKPNEKSVIQNAEQGIKDGYNFVGKKIGDLETTLKADVKNGIHFVNGKVVDLAEALEADAASGYHKALDFGKNCLFFAEMMAAKALSFAKGETQSAVKWAGDEVKVAEDKMHSAVKGVENFVMGNDNSELKMDAEAQKNLTKAVIKHMENSLKKITDKKVASDTQSTIDALKKTPLLLNAPKAAPKK